MNPNMFGPMSLMPGLWSGAGLAGGQFAPVSGMNSLGPQLGLPATEGAGLSGQVQFQEMLMKALAETNATNTNAQQAIEGSLAGEDLSLVETMTAIREADMAMRLLLQVRNKLVQAYQEIQQIRI